MTKQRGRSTAATGKPLGTRQRDLLLDGDNQDAKNFLAAAEKASRAGPHPAQLSATAPVRDPQAIHEVPTSFANGRYQVKRFLGEGGKKKVYLAHDETLDRDVAFALIKTDGLDDAGRERIQREAQAMGRMGSNPHIVQVYDFGEEQGAPYLVQELMGGGDVEELIEDAEDHRLPFERAVQIAVETCRGLEFSHAQGIVHRDLKPGNVWLTADGVAKIGDFGLAVSTDRSRLTQEGMMVGTVSYMPPEQALGGEVTPQSDLYSLGAMLYEMVTGRPPFLGDDPVSIIGQHINTLPVAPSWHNPEVASLLDCLILQMLAKVPADRPADAGEVGERLEEGNPFGDPSRTPITGKRPAAPSFGAAPPPWRHTDAQNPPRGWLFRTFHTATTTLRKAVTDDRFPPAFDPLRPIATRHRRHPHANLKAQTTLRTRKSRAQPNTAITRDGFAAKTPSDTCPPAPRAPHHQQRPCHRTVDGRPRKSAPYKLDLEPRPVPVFIGGLVGLGKKSGSFQIGVVDTQIEAIGHDGSLVTYRRPIKVDPRTRRLEQ